MNLEEVAIEYAECPTCDMKPGDTCITNRGTFATYTHAPRLDVVSGPYWRGYEAGERDSEASK